MGYVFWRVGVYAFDKTARNFFRVGVYAFIIKKTRGTHVLVILYISPEENSKNGHGHGKK